MSLMMRPAASKHLSVGHKMSEINKESGESTAMRSVNPQPLPPQEERTLEPQLQAIMAHLEDAAQAVNYKGKRGYFFNPDDLAKAEELVAFANSGRLQMLTPEKEEAYKADLRDMREMLDSANKSLQDLKSELDVAKKELAAQEERTATELSLKDSKFKLAQTSKMSLQTQLAAAKTAHEQTKESLRKARSGRHPSIDLEEAEQMTLHSASEVTRLNNELQRVNTEVKEANTKVAEESQRAKVLREQVAFLESQMADFHGAQAAAVSLKPLKPATVSLNKGFLTRVLGTKGIEWLQKEELIDRQDTRDRAYHLMQAANAGHTRVYKSLGEVLFIAWSALKRMSKASWKHLNGWLEEVTRDFRAGTLKSIKFYREKLEKVLEALKQQTVVLKRKVARHSATGKEKESGHHQDSYWSWFKRAMRRSFEKVKNTWFSTPKPVLRAWKTIKSWFSRGKTTHETKANSPQRPKGKSFAEVLKGESPTKAMGKEETRKTGDSGDVIFSADDQEEVVLTSLAD